MPTIKVKRNDILRPKEVLQTVEKAKDFKLDWLACLIGLTNVFGKRISECISLKKDQITQDTKFLYVRFHVGKKRDKDRPIPIFHIKKKTLQHPLMPYIISYVDQIQDGYIFPSNRSRQTGVNKMKIKLKNGEVKNVGYAYSVEGGFISRQLALYYLKKVAPDWWWHLARESLATRMAEEGATEEELMHWFDWSRVDMAHVYVKRGTKLTEKWSERTW